MKRLHVHLAVGNLEKSIGFYSKFFQAEPTVTKNDYAKWMLEDPRINFAISSRSSHRGLEHLGIQVDSEQELETVREGLNSAELSLFDEGSTTCCYASSDKSWVKDPDQIPWEVYLTMGEAEFFHGSEDSTEECCSPSSKQKESCCEPGGCC